MNILKNEPAAIASAVRVTMVALITFGVINWTDDQLLTAMVAFEAVLLLFVRSQSASAGTLGHAGTTVREVTDVARDPGMMMLPVTTEEAEWSRRVNGGDER